MLCVIKSEVTVGAKGFSARLEQTETILILSTTTVELLIEPLHRSSFMWADYRARIKFLKARKFYFSRTDLTEWESNFIRWADYCIKFLKATKLYISPTHGRD
jgi:hypothetical protein